MPKVDLGEALVELDEARQTERDIQNLLDYGTDDPERVARLEAEMHEATLRSERGLRWVRDERDREDWEDFWYSYFDDGLRDSLTCPANQPVDPRGLDWEEDDEWSWMDFD